MLAHQKWVEMEAQVFETILCFIKINTSLIYIKHYCCLKEVTENKVSKKNHE
jgi:hypothetical protein